MSSKLELIRVSKGLSQSALARLAGCSQGLVWKLENGTIAWKEHHYKKFAKALGVNPSDLLPDSLSNRVSSDNAMLDTHLLKKVLLWAFKNCWEDFLALSAVEQATALTKAYRIVSEQRLDAGPAFNSAIKSIIKPGK